MLSGRRSTHRKQGSVRVSESASAGFGRQASFGRQVSLQRQGSESEQQPHSPVKRHLSKKELEKELEKLDKEIPKVRGEDRG